MSPRYTFALLLACAWGIAVASDGLGEAIMPAHDSCPSLLTEVECRTHHRILQVLPAGEERRAYLTMHAQLLEERQAACACTRSDNQVSLLSTR